MPKTQEQFAYDRDGNLTSDGHWNYGWDAENRLLTLSANTAVGPQISLRFEYDRKSRRIRKQVWSNTTWNGTPVTDVKFLHDAWNVVAELNALSASTLLRSYLWGTDLSGSARGAGGVGGLLEFVYYGSAATNCFAAYGGNGNVAALVNAADGTSVAQYEYAPFGEVIRATGPLAKPNPFRFSTKYQDDEADTVYYGYRYYAASVGRWLGRDPLLEPGFVVLRDGPQMDKPKPSGAPRPLYRAKIQTQGFAEQSGYPFVENSPISTVDPLGLESASDKSCTEDQTKKVKDAIAAGCNKLRAKAPHKVCCNLPMALYSAISGVCNHPDDIKFFCPAAESEKCKAGDCGKAQVSGDTMWLCPKAFTIECGELDCTVLHEIIHLGGADQQTALTLEKCACSSGNK